MPQAGSRMYYPAEGGPEEVGTAVGVIGKEGLDASELPADQIIQLDRLVTSGMLEAEGPAMDAQRELDPSKQHMLENKVTQAAALRKPYAAPADKLAITREMGGKTTVAGGGLSTTNQTADGMTKK